MRRVYVLGAGITKYGKSPFSARELALEASRKAILSAQLSPSEIQAGFVANAFSLSEKQGHLGPIVMSGLGIPDAPASTIESACASGASAVREAWINIGAGIYDCMLVVGVEKVSQLDTITATTYFSFGSDYIFEGACGASFPGLYGALARAHMTKYGTTELQLANVAVKNHENALLNPNAHLHKKISVEDVLHSPVVASPLKLFDSCPFSDGAAAAVLCSEDYLRLKGRTLSEKILIRGSGRAGGTGALHQRKDLTTLGAAVLAGREAFNRAGLSYKDIDFAEVHDCFTIAELVAEEDLGFFPRGDAAKMTEQGVTKIGGDLPINPSGGLKAKGHPVGATGVGQVVEIFEQLNGIAGERQVKDSRIGLTHNVGATGGSCGVHIFELT
ncbi:MAG TPA: thiolase domain-containing protein [Nitrososphaerales archaeon]|nr:thiolase domain-containing protein [Nitrososphaerales archaeon]